MNAAALPLPALLCREDASADRLLCGASFDEVAIAKSRATVRAPPLRGMSMRKQIYRDATDDADAAERFQPLDAVAGPFHAQGLRELCKMESVGTFTDAPNVFRHEWLVFVTDDGAISISTQITNGRQSLYAASQLANGTIIETNSWPSLHSWWSLGPFAVARDRRSGRVQRWASNDLPSMLEVHRAAQDEEAARAGSVPRIWSVKTYLAFRRASYLEIWADLGARVIIASWLTGLAITGCLTALAVIGPRWPVWLIAIACFVLATYLIGWRLAVWMARGFVKQIPMASRVRLATLWESGQER